MPIYKGTMEITKIADLLTATEHEITEVFFGDKQVFTVWGEYDGTLPATYSANGSMLADYRIYGASGGVGDGTINLFDISAKNSVVSHSNIAQPTTWNVYDGDAETLRCPCEGNKTYMVSIPETTASFRISTTSSSSIPVRNLPVSVTRIVSAENIRSYTFTTPADAKFILCQFAITTSTEMRHAMCINEGTSAPPVGNVVPYGYEVDMGVSDGSTATTTPIYIGDPLEEDEYVSFKEQKVYRMVNGVLTPTDPPVSLPALPTVDGTNITDYAGQSTVIPSRFYAKYRKKDF